MKNEKGITITSLMIYLVCMLIIIVVLTVITGYIYKGIGINNDYEEFNSDYTRLLSYISKEVNEEGNRVSEIVNENGQYKIKFKNQKQITFVSNSVYYQNIKICDNVSDFKAEVDPGDKQKLTIELEKQEKKLSNSFIFYLN